MYYKQRSPQNAVYNTINLHICTCACWFCFFIMHLQFVEHNLFLSCKIFILLPGAVTILAPPHPHPLWIANAPADIRTNDLPNKCSVQPRAQSCQWQVFLFAIAPGSTVTPTHPHSQLMGTGEIKSVDYTTDLCSTPANYAENEHAVRKKLSNARTEKHYDNDGVTALSDKVNFLKILPNCENKLNLPSNVVSS